MHNAHMKHNPKQPSNLRRTSLVAPADDLDRLREIAESENRSLSGELRRLIAQRVAEASQTKEAA
jgi:hypothetical protein